jgi:adenosine deaminase
MNFERGNMEILFAKIPYYKITENCFEKSKKHDAGYVNQKLYMTYSKNVFTNYSEDELINIYSLLRQEMKSVSVFSLVANFAMRLLTYTGQEIQCKLEEVLRWREISYQLSQDFFTCAFLAKYDLDYGKCTDFFAWSPIIYSDDTRLKGILAQGIADNHFHLNGSTKVFELNWISLMNIIKGRKHDFKKMYQGRQLRYTDEMVRDDKRDNLYESCQRAALYRVYLFSCIVKDEFLKEKASGIYKKLRTGIYISTLVSEIQGVISLAKQIYGAKIEDDKVLDYAFQKDMKELNNNKCRLLSGERRFLYECYKNAMDNKFDSVQRNMFYVYLSIRTYFRGELIQVNRQVGFANFSEYQDRKEIFIEGIHLYERELVRLAIEETLSKPYMKSLEARICPDKRPVDLYKKVNYYQKFVKYDDSKRLYYVLHFQKSKGELVFTECQSRDYAVRRRVEKQAKSIATILENCKDIAGYIKGIDACSNEIGCRPEVFAQAYRYLSDLIYKSEYLQNETKLHIETERQKEIKRQKETKVQKEMKLHLTYHAGEDFLDIVDGLRAIDETILFCGLRRGSRIGHALALGIDPKSYYHYKSETIILEKQMLIDDIAWLLCRADELGVSVDVKLRTLLEKQFYLNFNYVYKRICQNYKDVRMFDYFQSWKLRGDNPELHRTDESIIPYGFDKYGINTNICNDYMACNSKSTCNDFKKCNDIRGIAVVKELYKNYHYSEQVRTRGIEKITFKIEEKYVELVQNIQDKMINQLAIMGIAVESNPSSNYLIGTIQKYAEHPIIRFNGRKLYDMKKNMSLSVSINTDDQGIFDTMLENEYALMELALRKEKDDDGEEKYDIESIYEWIDYIRKMGLEQVFR